MRRDNGRRGKPTSRDVAALAGVAQSTVSAAMSSNRTVAAETKQRIEQAMAELGYQPNAGARTLRTSRTNVIALVLELSSHVDGSETLPYLDAVIEGARGHDYDVVFSLASEGQAGLRRLLGRSICDGVLIMDAQRDDDRIATAVELGAPVVLMGRPDDPGGLDAVDFNSPLAAQLLVDDLADTGHDHIIVLVSEPANHMVRFWAFNGFYDAVVERARERGLEVELLIPASQGWRDVNELMPTIADAAARSRLGVIARSPRATEWGLRLAAEIDLRVGMDLSLAALCTDEIAQSFETGITNVSPRPRDMVERAVDRLFRRIAGATQQGVVDLVPPLGLTRRESTVRFDLRH